MSELKKSAADDTKKSPKLAAEPCARLNHVFLLTSVQSKETFVAQHFLKTVEAVFIHQLPDHRACTTLVLHPGLHQVYGIYCGGPHSYEQSNF